MRLGSAQRRGLDLGRDPPSGVLLSCSSECFEVTSLSLDTLSCWCADWSPDISCAARRRRARSARRGVPRSRVWPGAGAGAQHLLDRLPQLVQLIQAQRREVDAALAARHAAAAWLRPPNLRHVRAR